LLWYWFFESHLKKKPLYYIIMMSRFSEYLSEERARDLSSLTEGDLPFSDAGN